MTNSSPSITPSEWRWAIGWSSLVVGLSCVPYVVAALTTSPGWQFAGLLVNPLDGHSYLAKIRQGMEGNWLFHLTYTPEPHQGVFVYTFYLALGHLAGWLGLSPIWMFHLARLAAGWVLLPVAYCFTARVTPHLAERRLAFIFLLTASGLGWLGVMFGAFPIDLWIPEAFVPYSLYTNPHFPLAMTLMLLIFLKVEDSAFTFHPSSFIICGLAALALASLLPFAMLTVWMVLAVHLGWLALSRRQLPWPQLMLALIVGLGSAPVVIYEYWALTSNPIMAGWLIQNVTAAPAPVNLLLGYGLVGLLAIMGGWLVVSRSNLAGLLAGKSLVASGEWLVVWWAVTTLILMYLPFDLQRRLITGLHLPLCILAALGLRRWLAARRWSPRRSRQLTLAVVTIGALGTLFVWVIPLLAARQSPTASEPSAMLFMRNEEVAAFDWLRQHATMDTVVLASPRVGMFVPGQTGARTFYGHPFETVEAKQKKTVAEAFYRGEVAPPPAADFVIYGPAEQQLGQPQILGKWPVVFEMSNLKIFAPPGQKR